ncbi:MAG: inositol monophosphatase [Clostridiales bacterium]|nr:inositol monophosphatase [Clostridiales bacterium]
MNTAASSNDMLSYIQTIVRKAGGLVRDASMDRIQIHEKTSSRDISTQYDKLVQNTLMQKLQAKVPDAGFIMEESESAFEEAFSRHICFFIDPIDGTSNFANGYRHSCICVGMTVDGTPEIGVVYNPYLDEMFWAQRGGGAFLNGHALHVDSEKSLRDCIVGFGTCPYNKELTKETFDFAKTVFYAANDLRRSGSSAMDICYAAAGRIGLFYELSLFPWDYAASCVILTEAGGCISNVEGGPLSFTAKSSVAAGGETAYQEFLKLRKSYSFCP